MKEHTKQITREARTFRQKRLQQLTRFDTCGGRVDSPGESAFINSR